MILLDNRLQTIYNMIRANSRIVDVGSDHGYLITKLILDKKCQKGKCIDINKKCLQKSKITATKHNISEKICFSLSSGLNDVLEDEVDDIVIAGMGSKLIIKILDECVWAKKNNNKHFVLQPMVKPWILREYLYKSGFEIIAEEAIKSNNFFYVVIKVKFSGKIKKYTDLDVFVGTLLNNQNEVTKEYLSFLISKLKSISQNILLSNNNIEKYNYYKKLLDQIDYVI